MKQSQLFSKTTKTTPKDEESVNAKLLVRAGFVHKEMAGVYSFLPLGLRVLRKIENIIREEMEAIGGEELLLPVLHPKKNWVQTGRWETLDDLFKFTSFYSKTEYVLGPTHEEIVTPLTKNFISSYKDLPKYVFQIQAKFRDEKRAKAGLLRGREFLMKDLYSFHATVEDGNKYYEIAIKAYWKILERIGLASSTVFTFASGGSFSKYSHEFQTISKAGEDTIYICDACGVAVNDEIIKEQKVCPECGTKKLRKERAIEVGNIFKLKTKYSKEFGLTYTDEKGKKREVIMSCYGIGLSRLMGTVVEIFHDAKGIIWPKSLSPFAVHLIALKGGEVQAEKLYHDLKKQNIEVLYDERQGISAGEKFADADLIGIFYRLVVSAKTLKEDSVEVKKRNESKEKLVKLQDVKKALKL